MPDAALIVHGVCDYATIALVQDHQKVLARQSGPT